MTIGKRKSRTGSDTSPRNRAFTPTGPSDSMPASPHPSSSAGTAAHFTGCSTNSRSAARKTIKHLSRGQKTLLSIALALSHEADLLILDEPTAGLDIVLRRTILDRLRQFVADGERTVVVASHITDGLEEIAEYVNFLDEGKLVFQSEKDELLARWKRIHFREGALSPDLVRQFADVRVQPFGSSGLTRDFSAIREQLAPGIAAGDVKVENARLDEILIAMLKGE